MMEINLDSWKTRLIAFTSGGDLPSSNLCSYFWAFVVSILFLPISYPIKMVNRVTSESIPGVAGIFSLAIGIFVISLAALSLEVPLPSFNWVFLALPFFLSVVGCFVMILGFWIVGLLTEIWDHIWGWREVEIEVKSRKESLLIAYLKAKKAKMCPPITYVKKKGQK